MSGSNAQDEQLLDFLQGFPFQSSVWSNPDEPLHETLLRLEASGRVTRLQVESSGRILWKVEKRWANLEHALAVAEEVGIGPGDGDTSTVREHLREMEAVRVWLGTCDAVLDDIEDATVENGGLLLDQPAIRNGMDLIDPRDGGRWLTVTTRKPTDPPSPTEHRFGGRLRQWLANDWLAIKATDDAGLRDIADAIDQDASEEYGLRVVVEQALVSRTEAHRDALHELGTLHRKIEQLVEELRFSVAAPWVHDGEERDVIGADEIMERLGGIFGTRPEPADCRTATHRTPRHRGGSVMAIRTRKLTPEETIVCRLIETATREKRECKRYSAGWNRADGALRYLGAALAEIKNLPEEVS